MSNSAYSVSVADVASQTMRKLARVDGTRCGRLAARVRYFAESGALGSYSIVAARGRMRACIIPVVSEIGSGMEVGALLLLDDRERTISVERIYRSDEKFAVEVAIDLASDLLRARS